MTELLEETTTKYLDITQLPVADEDSESTISYADIESCWSTSVFYGMRLGDWEVSLLREEMARQYILEGLNRRIEIDWIHGSGLCTPSRSGSLTYWDEK